MADTEIAKRIIGARIALIFDQPFFGSLALRLKLVENNAVPTMCTDGNMIAYNPDFVRTLSDAELKGVIAHEVLHCANGHPWRRDARDPFKFNIACDYAINYILEDARFTLPKGRLRSPEFDGKAAEWIYNRLPDIETMSISAGAAPGAGGQDITDAPPAGENGAASEAEWREAVQQAAAAAKARGNLPRSLERFVEASVEARVDWRSVLRRFLQASAREDYAWSKPNARHLARGLYLPGLRSEAMGPIAIAVDTSGSIDDVLLAQFAAEVSAVASELRPERVTVIYCDAAVNRIETFERDEPITMTPCGGGGTAFAPAIDAAEALDEPPVCLVYLTDLMGSHRHEPPAFPVLWAHTYEGEVPYGEKVSMVGV